MSTESKLCLQCGAAIPVEVLQGLCPRCLFAGVASPTDPGIGPPGTKIIPPPPNLDAVRAAFPQFEILELIGRGGMGVVYKARQKSLGRLVALKLLAPGREHDPAFAERFAREARALAGLNHPSLVTVHDFGQAGGFYYLLMEFVDGVNLRQAMKAGRFTPEQALAIVPPVCEALQFAHDRGVVHRDIKPENLLLDKDGRVKIVDFGIAKILEPGRAALPLGPDHEVAQQRSPTTESLAAGTPAYMAPEQRSAPQRTDHRADIYSLGVVLYELLTGELPADKLQPPSSRLRGMQIDVRLDEIVLRALEANPELRFATATDFRTQVEAVVSTPRGSRRESAQSSTAPPRFLKVGTSTLTTPAEIGTYHGQFFLYRTRGQLILDDHQLTHSCAGSNTVILLAAIRDLSIGTYPRSMNPTGLDFLGVTYEDNGEQKHVLLSPMESWFGFPSTFNARVAEWFAAIREAVIAATGRAPSAIPAVHLDLSRGSSIPLYALALVPVLIGVVLLTVLVQTNRHDVSNPYTHLAFLFVCAAISFGFLAPWLLGRFFGGRGKASPDKPKLHKHPGLWMLLLAVLVIGFSLLRFYFFPGTLLGITSCEVIPVGVTNNIAIVDVFTQVGRWSAEITANLTGPRLSRETEIATTDALFPPFADTFIMPTPYASNQPWRMLPAGRQLRRGLTWRLGFVLPSAALARQALENLRPIGPLPAEPERTFAGTLFEVSQPDGQTFRAALQVSRPLSSADPNWVSVSGMSSHNESTLTFNWVVLASQPGSARFARESNFGSTQPLNRSAKSELYELPVRFELTKLGTNQVLLVTEVGGVKSREELPGSFRDLAKEVLRTGNKGMKSVRGTRIELCQIQGQSFTVEVPASLTAASKVQDHARFNWLAVAVVLVLTIGLAGVGLLILLVRKGGSGNKNWLVLLGVPLLFFAIFLAAVIGWLATRSAPASTYSLREPLADSPASPPPPAEAPPTQNALRPPGSTTEATTTVPLQIEFKIVRVENPPGTRNILLHFERDTNYGLALEVWQDVTPSSDGRKLPGEGYRTWQQKSWIGLNSGRILQWALPVEFTESEVRGVAKDMEKRSQTWRELEDGARREFATVVHRDGWKYHLLASVKREMGAPQPPPPSGMKLLGQLRVAAQAGGILRATLSLKQNDRADTSPRAVTFRLAADRPGKLLFRWYAAGVEIAPGRQWLVDVVDENTGLIFHRFEGAFGRAMKVISPHFSADNDSTLQFNGSTHMTGRNLFHAEEIIAPDQPVTLWQDAELDIMFSLYNAAFGLTPQFQLATPGKL